MSTTLIVLAVLVLIILFAVTSYNRLIRLNVSVDEAFAQIEVQLKRRKESPVWRHKKTRASRAFLTAWSNRESD